MKIFNMIKRLKFNIKSSWDLEYICNNNKIKDKIKHIIKNK